MNRKDLIEQLADELSISTNDAKHFVKTFLKVVTKGLQKDEHVMLTGFGTFWYWNQGERAGRNVRTGEVVMIKPRHSLKFKPGRDLLNILNKREKKTI